MIAGQNPNREWKPNPDGRARSIEEAIEIAERYGVQIPDDVAFYLDEYGYIDGPDTFARGPSITKSTGSIVNWSDLVHDRTGKVPFLVRRDVFESDEAIVAVFAHEMHELQYLRPLLQEGGMSVEDFIGHTCPGNPGNIHDEAWDVADVMVDRMGGGG